MPCHLQLNPAFCSLLGRHSMSATVIVSAFGLVTAFAAVALPELIEGYTRYSCFTLTGGSLPPLQ